MAKYFKFDTKQIRFVKYNNDRTALQFVDPVDGPLCIASVNIPEVPLKDDEIIIKNYSENEGVLEDLISNNIVGELHTVPCGFTEATICKLLVNPDDYK